MTLTTTVVSGSELLPYIPDLARLRIQVFRDYPYLYEGTADYEARYLQTYIQAEHAMAVLALDNQQVVGASTGVPMLSESTAFKRPFEDAGIDTSRLFYCGESVLLPDYRGRGIYRDFFQKREDFARRLGDMAQICFCGVVRPDAHPLKPPTYQGLDAVWHHFGYRARPDLIAHFPWRDIGQAEATQHPMMFWLKSL